MLRTAAFTLTALAMLAFGSPAQAEVIHFANCDGQTSESVCLTPKGATPAQVREGRVTVRVKVNRRGHVVTITRVDGKVTDRTVR